AVALPQFARGRCGQDQSAPDAGRSAIALRGEPEEFLPEHAEHPAGDEVSARPRKGSRRSPAGQRTALVPTFPKFVLHCRTTVHELRKVMGTSKPMILVPLSI